MSGDRLLTRAQVAERTTLSRTTLQRRVEAGEFPPPVRLGPPPKGRVAWRESDVDRWIGELPNDDDPQ